MTFKANAQDASPVTPSPGGTEMARSELIGSMGALARPTHGS